jgi:hypothetical protein
MKTKDTCEWFLFLLCIVFEPEKLGFGFRWMVYSARCSKTRWLGCRTASPALRRESLQAYFLFFVIYDTSKQRSKINPRVSHSASTLPRLGHLSHSSGLRSPDFIHCPRAA